MDIRKNKNLIIIVNNDGRTNTIDIETGVILGKLQKPVKSLSPDMKQYCNGIRPHNTNGLLGMAIIYYLENQTLVTLSRADKISALGLRGDLQEITNMNEATFNAVKFNKEFVAYLKSQHDSNFTLRAWNTYQIVKDLTEEEHATWANFTNLPESITQDVKELKKCLAWLGYLRQHEHIQMMNSSTNMVYSYIEKCALLEKTDIFTKNFLTNYAKVLFEYQAQAEKFKDIAFKKNQEKAKLDYKNETFTIIVPTSAKEINDEAEQQRNCVRSYYDYVSRGELNIVFLRYNTNLARSVLTLEIRKGEIVQTKARFNEYPNNEQKKLVAEYQNYLKNR